VFLTEYAPVRDTHYLLPLSLDSSSASLSVDEVLAALSTGDTEAILDDDDDPSWATTLASPDKEYWIAGACDKLKSLENLNRVVQSSHLSHTYFLLNRFLLPNQNK
jgi:hypothetical protein